jgi:class 3 adenylate cyclase
MAVPAAASPKKSNDSPIRVADAPAAENLEGERKTVTALFADIKGSMELMEDLDPEEARAIVDPAIKLMIDSAHRYGGYIVQSTGDGIFALFGAPVAHEDHPQRALFSALRMQEEVKRYAERLRADKGVNLQVRVGVNTGEVVIRSIRTDAEHTEYTPIGHSTSLASRLQALAAPGSIAISETVRKLVEGYFALKPLGPARIKGVSEPVNVFEVTGLGPLRTRLQRSAGRGLSKFVGRDREMEALKHVAELAAKGRGQIVAAVAEAGTGKSRLYFEFKAVSQSGWMVLEAFSVSHGKASAYLPVLDLLHTYFKITPDDDARARREKVTGRVLALDRSFEDALPYVFALLGIKEGDDPVDQIDTQVKKRSTLDAIKRILLRESLNQPLMVIFEDLHWIDEQTQEFLILLADSIANARILLLVNYRPEYSHQWGSKTYYTQLRLDPLGKESADEMLSALLGDNPELWPLKRVIVERTEGNPFFMEETVQVLLDEGALVRDDGNVKLTKPIAELKIPPTVQGILAARIDRLPADAKDLLQTLSVIGRQFPMSLIRAVVSKPKDDLDRLLNDLQLGEFIYEQPALADTEYVFKHALTQEVAYNSLLIERRKQMHERIGLAIESIYADSIDDRLSELAHHFSRSADDERAVKFLSLAGRQSLVRHAYAEAIRRLRDGLVRIAKLPASFERDGRELEMLNALLRAMWVSVAFDARAHLEVLERAATLAEKTGNLGRLVALLSMRRIQFMRSGDYLSAAALAPRVLELARQEGSPASFANAYNGMLETYFYAGDLAGVEVQFALWEKFKANSWWPSVALGIAAICAWMMGRVPLARHRIAEASDLAAGVKDPFALIIAKWCEALLYFCLREPQNVMATALQVIAIREEHATLVLPDSLPLLRAWALAQLGKPEQASVLVDANVEGHTVLSNLTMLIRPEIEALTGALDAAMDSTQNALSAENQSQSVKPELLRIRGEIWLRRENPEAAEADFRESVACAQKSDAKMLELRAATSLGRLLRNTNRRVEARAMLAAIYNWFTEGLDTADLKDAKSLLDELGS